VRGLGCCIDLVVDYNDHGVQVSLEDMALTETLHALQLHDDSAAVERLVEMPLDNAALRAIADLLPRMFRAASLG
jgi:hypothetical protein